MTSTLKAESFTKHPFGMLQRFRNPANTAVTARVDFKSRELSALAAVFTDIESTLAAVQCR